MHKKNIRLLNSKPLIYYTIHAARAAGCLERIIVSTDDDEIAAVARFYGAEVIMRPQRYAQDASPTEDALIHVLDELKAKDAYEPDIVVTLEPTSPLRTPQTIRGCVELYEKSGADSVLTVVETRACYGRIVNGKFKYLFENLPRRRQARDPLFAESSTVYVTERETLRRKHLVLGDNLYGYIVPHHEAVDINEELDFTIAEVIMKEINRVTR